jgi:DNA-directed RNA polymerase specialized sigma24 family protein
VEPFASRRSELSELEHDRRLSCLHDCLDTLPGPSRELLTSYHLGGTGVHIGRRKDLALILNIPNSVLRLRAYRIRRQLEECLERCLARHGKKERFGT